MPVVVSVALPVYNAAPFLDECLASILKQTREIGDCSQNDSSSEKYFDIQVSVYDDGSTDQSPGIIKKWADTFRTSAGFTFCFSKNETDKPKGVGYGRNQTIKQSTGDYICFCDADDIMEPNRMAVQLRLSKEHLNAIIGSRFRRIPENSTTQFTRWANSLSEQQLETQVYLSFGPSVVMPTWFCHRNVYDRVPGGFDESGQGTPEDLIFFYKHLDLNGHVVRTEESLVIYRYHQNATTFSVTDEVIWTTRLKRLEEKVLENWSKFSIWNAGKLGRRFYRSLRKSSQDKVSCFCDVDKKKISQKSYHPYPLKVQIPIVHVKHAQPPFIICVKTEITWDADGDFRKLLDSLNLKEGTDYFYFN